jgi:hypothetical protein
MTPQERKQYMKEWHKNNPNYAKNQYQKPEIKEYNKQWREKNKEKINQYSKEYYQTPNGNKKKKEYIKNNKEKIKEYHKLYKKEIRQNPTEKIKHHLRVYIGQTIKEIGATKHKKSLDIVGLESWGKLREHIESQWENGMNWSNHGVGKNNLTWHIDHIIPLETAKTEEEVYKLNYYTNLKPMWGSDNIRKSDSVCGSQPT